MTQRTARDRQTIDHDFRSTFGGWCAKCKETYEPGTVIVKSVYGYIHAVCPKDVPPEE